MMFRRIYQSFFYNLLVLILLATLTTLTVRATELSTVVKETTIEPEVSNAQYALYQGDTKPAQQLINERTKIVQFELMSLALQNLQVSIWVQQDEVDKATDLLLSLQEVHSHNASVHFFAASAWKELGHEVSIFSKVKYYRRAVEAYIRAGELAPNNARYMRKQASAYAQPEMFGGIVGKQKLMLEKIIALDEKYGLVAKMDLAQNEEQDERAEQLANQAISKYADNFLLVERAAQMYWTLEKEDRAQQLFARACNFPAQVATDRITWISSCYGVVYLTLKTERNYSLAVSAMQRLLSVNTLKTADNEQAKLYLAQMAVKAGNKTLALVTYRELAEQGLDKSIKKEARKALRKLS